MAKNKIKTHRATAKRIKVTGKKKLIRRMAHQAHFNARKSRDHMRDVRTDRTLDRADLNRIKRLIPYLSK